MEGETERDGWFMEMGRQTDKNVRFDELRAACGRQIIHNIRETSHSVFQSNIWVDFNDD